MPENLLVLSYLSCISLLRQAVDEFLSEVRSKEQPHSAGLVSQPTAVKFLMARKFDVSRAINLFQAYKVEYGFESLSVRRSDPWSQATCC